MVGFGGRVVVLKGFGGGVEIGSLPSFAEASQ